MIKLGTQTGFAGGLGLGREEVYRSMAAAGFQSVDYPLMNWYTNAMWQLSDDELKAKMSETRKVINDNGIFVGQAHSPLDALWIDAPETKEARLHAQIQAIKAASWLGAPYIVIHPLRLPTRIRNEGYEENKELNMKFYRFLQPYLEEYNVKAAIENLFIFDPNLARYCESVCSSAAELKDYIDTLDSDRFVACLDVGHAVLGGQDPVKMIYELGKKYLHATHMQDNHFFKDDHLMPGMGKIDWYGIGKALNDIGYEDVFNYEADNSYGRLGVHRSRLSMKLMKLYAEFGKAVINVK